MGVRNFSCRDEACQDAGFPVFAPGLVPEVSKPDDPYGEIVGTSLAIRYVLRLVETVADGDSTALLLGETGTGKELIARAIHKRSPRRGRPFVKLNCAAIPTGLLESELFADKGTLFLDEIGDIPLELQPKLLRAIQEREFERLGSSLTKKVNVRIIAATHRDLETMIFRREFRADLYYRLNVFPICVPSLRERKGDIPLLVRHFTISAAKRMNKTIDCVATESMAALVKYSWPGNIRELENVIERAVILSTGSALEVPMRDLNSRITAGRDSAAQTLEEVERNHILATLKQTGWVLSGPRGAATRLGLNRSTLHFRMKKLGIFRSTESL